VEVRGRLPVPYPPVFDALARQFVGKRGLLLGVSVALIVLAFVIPGLVPAATEFAWKVITVGVAWCWGLAIAATWFGPGGFLHRSADMSVARRGARVYAAIFLTFYLVAPLLVFPLG